MSNVRNGRPSSKLLDRANRADEETYKLLTKAVTEAVIMRQKDVLVKLPYFCSFGEGFPKGIRTKYDDLNDVYRIKAEKLLNWLHENGWSNYCYSDLTKMNKKLYYLEVGIDKMLSDKMLEDVIPNEIDKGENDE